MLNLKSQILNVKTQMLNFKRQNLIVKTLSLSLTYWACFSIRFIMKFIDGDWSIGRQSVELRIPLKLASRTGIIVQLNFCI